METLLKDVVPHYEARYSSHAIWRGRKIFLKMKSMKWCNVVQGMKTTNIL